MVYVIVNQGLLCLSNCLFHGMELLGNVHAWSLFLNHSHDRSEMARDSFKSPHNYGMARMNRRRRAH